MCEICYGTSDAPATHHGRVMIECDAGCPGDDCTHPVVDDGGHILTHAPKWWIFRHRREPHGLAH
jgi:hypothetical protein